MARIETPSGNLEIDINAVRHGEDGSGSLSQSVGQRLVNMLGGNGYGNVRFAIDADDWRLEGCKISRVTNDYEFIYTSKIPQTARRS